METATSNEVTNSTRASCSSSNKMNNCTLKLPSYVGLSCAVSGYTNYSPYCSSARVYSGRENSPSLKNYDLLDSEKDHHNTGKDESTSSSPYSAADHQISSTDRLPIPHNTKNSSVCMNGFIKKSNHDAKKFALPTDSLDDDSEKSLVQKRIESLYGPGAAEVWRDSRSRVRRTDKVDGCSISGRSPSCPPNALRARENRKCPAVFSHLDGDFLNQIDREQVVTMQVKKEKVSTLREPPNKDESGAKEIRNLERETEVIIEENQSKTLHFTPSDRIGSDYLKRLDSVVSDIRRRIKITESFLENESHLMVEDVEGNLRSCIGKANLLIAQKMNQFRELCHKNMIYTSEDQFVTKNEDLDGFWEMIAFQIDDVNKLFDEILLIKDNGWIIPDTKKESSPKSNNRNTRKTTGSKAITTSQPKNTARDDMRRSKLREAKLRLAKKTAEECKDHSNIAIFLPPSSEFADADSKESN